MTTRLLLILTLAAAILPGAEKRTILAVFAHPDDEITVGIGCQRPLRRNSG